MNDDLTTIKRLNNVALHRLSGLSRKAHNQLSSHDVTEALDRMLELHKHLQTQIKNNAQHK